MVDKVRLWCARMQHMLRLEEASQEEEVMGKLRKWSRQDLEREGLSVCGLAAQPAGKKQSEIRYENSRKCLLTFTQLRPGELYGEKILEVSTTYSSAHSRRGDDWLFRKMAVGDMVLVTKGSNSPYHKRVETVEGMVSECVCVCVC
jgi:hypothetical protein